MLKVFPDGLPKGQKIMVEVRNSKDPHGNPQLNFKKFVKVIEDKPSPEKSTVYATGTGGIGNTEKPAPEGDMVIVSLFTTGPVMPARDQQKVPVVDSEEGSAGCLYFNKEGIEKMGTDWEEFVENASSGAELKIHAIKKNSNYLFIEKAM